MRRLINMFPEMHRILVTNVIPKSFEGNEHKLTRARHSIVKSALWGLSNYAASDKEILEKLFFNGNDSTLDDIIQLSLKCGPR